MKEIKVNLQVVEESVEEFRAEIEMCRRIPPHKNVTHVFLSVILFYGGGYFLWHLRVSSAFSDRVLCVWFAAVSAEKG